MFGDKKGYFWQNRGAVLRSEMFLRRHYTIQSFSTSYHLSFYLHIFRVITKHTYPLKDMICNEPYPRSSDFNEVRISLFLTLNHVRISTSSFSDTLLQITRNFTWFDTEGRDLHALQEAWWLNGTARIPYHQGRRLNVLLSPTHLK